jgi:hypothetical protein
MECDRLVCMKKLGVVVCLFLFTSACAGSESEELAQARADLAQTRVELDALKGKVQAASVLWAHIRHR